MTLPAPLVQADPSVQQNFDALENRLTELKATVDAGGGGGAEATTVSDTTTLNLTLTGTDIHGDVLDSPTVGGATAAQLRDRATHTGTQLAATISDLTAAVRAALSVSDTATLDLTFSAGAISGAVLDSPLLQGNNSAYHLARANHTGTQLSTTISDFNEASQDAVGGTLTDTATVDLTYDDAGNQIKADTLYPKQAEVDFGATPVYDATFTVTDAAVTTSHQIVPSLAGDAPTGKDADELEFDDIFMQATPGTGNFSLYMRGDEGYLAGTFKVNYVVG